MNGPRFKVGDRVRCIETHEVATIISEPELFEGSFDYWVRWDTDLWLDGNNFNRSLLRECSIVPAPPQERAKAPFEGSWIFDLWKGAGRPPKGIHVDGVHYSAGRCQALAERVVPRGSA
jgi:hypothetical protein